MSEEISNEKNKTKSKTKKNKKLFGLIDIPKSFKLDINLDENHSLKLELGKINKKNNDN